LVRGDHEVNDIKLKNLYGATVVELASAEETKETLNCVPGFVGPINVSNDVEVVADHAIAAVVNGVCGANEEHFHFQGVNIDRDAKISQYADLRFIQEGDKSPDGEGVIKFAKGIEVGHVFKLGTRYSEAMDATFLDENGRTQPMIMGCYGIGVSRTLAAIIEQYNDESGIVWPESVAPFQIHVIPVNVKNDAQKDLSDKLYAEFLQKGYDVLLDDRPERVGVKFADSDLIGLPVRVTVGKKAEDGIVEVKVRKTGESFEVSVTELYDKIKQLLGN
jgi:prolyl-tRNA synthetase